MNISIKNNIKNFQFYEIKKKISIIKDIFIKLKLFKNIVNTSIINKIVINVRLGINGKNKKYLEKVSYNIFLITNQIPKIIYAHKSILNFGIKEKNPIALKISLRRILMWKFLCRFIKLIHSYSNNNLLIMSKDSFDSDGNYSFGVKDYSIFNEVKYVNESYGHCGFDVNIIFFKKTKIQNLYCNYKFLKLLGFIFKD